MKYAIEHLNRIAGVLVHEVRPEDDPDQDVGFWSIFLTVTDLISIWQISHAVNVALKKFGHQVEFVPNWMPDFIWVLRCYDTTPPEQVIDYLRWAALGEMEIYQSKWLAEGSETRRLDDLAGLLDDVDL